MLKRQEKRAIYPNKGYNDVSRNSISISWICWNQRIILFWYYISTNDLFLVRKWKYKNFGTVFNSCKDSWRMIFHLENKIFWKSRILNQARWIMFMSCCFILYWSRALLLVWYVQLKCIYLEKIKINNLGLFILNVSCCAYQSHF